MGERERLPRPEISRPDACTDPFSDAIDLAGGPSTMALGMGPAFPDGGIRPFLLIALPNRCKAEKTLRAMAVSSVGFIKFARGGSTRRHFPGRNH